jgi:hypothetical protein
VCLACGSHNRPATLAGADVLGSGHDSVPACEIGRSEVHREGAAARPRRASPAEDEAAPVANRDPPPPITDVLVDLELAVQAAVVEAGLQLPNAALPVLVAAEAGVALSIDAANVATSPN